MLDSMGAGFRVPAMPILELVVAGDPIPKARARTAKTNTYTPLRTREAEQRVAWSARQKLGPGFAPVTQPVGVAVEFYCATYRRKDGDNMFKLVTDALNGVVYADDGWIDEHHVRVIRGVGRGNARSEIFVWALT